MKARLTHYSRAKPPSSYAYYFGIWQLLYAIEPDAKSEIFLGGIKIKL